MQDVAAIQCLQMENKALHCKVAVQQQHMAAQAQRFEAQEQCMHEAMKGQEQPVANLEQQVDNQLSMLKDEQQAREAAFMVSASTQ